MMALPELINNVANAITEASNNYEIISDVLLESDETLITQPTHGGELIESALQAPFNSQSELDLKKIMSTALLIGKATGLISNEMYESLDGTMSAVIADETVTKLKTAYQVGCGMMDSYEATDLLIDKVSARVIAVTEIAVDNFIETGINKIAMSISMAYPPLLPVAMSLKYFQPVITQKAKQYIGKGINNLNYLAKSMIRKTSEKIKEIALNHTKKLIRLA